MKKLAYIFDLDNTTINSDHRVQPCMLPNGDLDLQKYIAEACTDEKIHADSLLPLASYMQQLIAAGETVVILTARHCNNADYIFIRRNQLRPTIHLSRDRCADIFGADVGKQVYRLGDAEYKRQYLLHLFQTLPNHDFIFFDDHDGVLAMAADYPNVRQHDAKIINKIMEQQFGEAYRQGEEDCISMYESLIEDCSGIDLVLDPEWTVEALG